VRDEDASNGSEKGDEGGSTPSADSDGTADGNDVQYPMLYYDPLQWYVLRDGSVLAAMINDGYYYYEYYYEYSSKGSFKGVLVPWGSNAAFDIWVNMTYTGYMDHAPIGTSSKFLLPFSNYYTGGTTVVEASFDGKAVTVQRTFEVKGRVAGANSALTRLYTQADWYDDKGYYTTLGVYDIEEEPVFMKGADIAPGTSVVYIDDTLIVCAPSYYWYYRGGIYMDGDYSIDVAMPAEKAMAGDSDPDEQAYYLLAITLDGNGVFSDMVAHNIKGYWYLAFSQDRTLVLSSGQSASGLRFASDGSAEYLGPWTVYGSPSGGGVDKGTIALAFGYSGSMVVKV
jgi:hypothetical protein